MTGDYSTPDVRQRFTAQARAAADRSDLVLCVSAFTASQVESLLNVPAQKLRVIHHGVHTPAEPPAPENRESIILSVGSIQKRKNTARLVEAFEQTRPGWKLILAGAAGFGASDITAQIQRSPRAADIEVTGYVTNAALHSLYRRASLFAFPSLDEGFGIPVIEAQACGTPVIVTNFSAQPELVGSGWTVPYQPWWDFTQASWLALPSITGIMKALEEAYLARDDDEYRTAALEKAQEYDADKVYAENWRPVLTKLEKSLTPPTSQQRRAKRRAA
jgi:glycosyltransferase involved in cell wall biosynthesis